MEESGEEERKRNGSRVKKTLQRGLLSEGSVHARGKILNRMLNNWL